MSDVTFERASEIVPENKFKSTVVGGQAMLIGATCTKCGLETGLLLSGTKFFCQNCSGVGDPHQDGDSCSELNRL